MKSKILFSALIMATAFSACTQEDIAVNNENASMEVVGAKLLASGLSINSGEGADSRVAVENGVPSFTKGDKAAVAWNLKKGGAATEDQTNTTISELSDYLFANHMLVHDGSRFESRGNIYEGWHFAYRPFQYMSKPAQLEVVVNDSTPLVEANLDIDWYLNGPMFSNALFLSDENVDVEDGVVKADMPLYFVHNTIRPELNVSDEFTGDELLKQIAITGITLNAGKGNNLFVEKFKVQPKGFKDIAALDDDENVKNDSIDESYFGSSNAFKFENSDLDSMVITTINNVSAYNLGKAKNTVRMFLAPTQDASDITVEDLSFRVDVAGGHFDVVYTPEEDEDGEEVELTKVQIANNTALYKLLYRLKGEENDDYNPSARDLRKLWIEKDGKKQQTPYQTIAMSLALENFTADYLIEDSTDWNGCVALANALCKEDEVPTFTLVPGAQVVFDNAIIAPENGVKVVGDSNNPGQLIINGNLTWNNDVIVERSNKDVTVVINENKQLNVVEGKLQPYRINNYGTIFADSLSTIGTKGYNNLNYNNRIQIQYGAYVYPATTSVTKGDNIIAYNVPANETAARIKTLIEGGTGTQRANVNTLIIENGVVLDLTPIAGGTTAGDRYNNNQTANDTEYPALDAVNVELNKGTLKSTAVVNVKNLTLAGESNTVNNINVLGELTVEGGTNTIISESVAGDATIKAGETTITGTEFTSNVTVEGGKLTLVGCQIEGTLNNKGTVVLNNTEEINIHTLTNNGTLTTNQDIIVTDVNLNAGSTTDLSSKTIWYTGEYSFTNMTLKNGTVKHSQTEALANAIAAAEDNTETTIELESDIYAAYTIPSNKNIVLDLNGHTIKATNAAHLAGSDGTKTQVLQILEGSEITLKNGTIESTVAKMLIQNYGTLTLENMTLTAQVVDGYKSYAISNNNGTVTISGKTNITAPNAFDIYDYASYTGNPSVTVNTTGTITGNIEVGSNKTTPVSTFTLTVTNGTIVGDLIVEEDVINNFTKTIADTAKVQGKGWE